MAKIKPKEAASADFPTFLLKQRFISPITKEMENAGTTVPPDPGRRVRMSLASRVISRCRGGFGWRDSRCVPEVCRGLVTVILGLAGGCLLAAGPGYLAQKGPAPLRFAPFSDPFQPFSWPAASTSQSNLLLRSEPVNPTNIVSRPIEEPVAATNSVSAETYESVSPAFPQELPGSSPQEVPDMTPQNYPAPPNQLIWITPQMLAELLKPGGGATNTPPVAPAGPESFWFMPPVPHPPPSSEAIYKTQ